MENQELKAEIGRLIQTASDDVNGDTRSDLFDRYMGEPYGDEIANKSAFVSTDGADVIEAMLADIMDVFTSAENILEFAPVGAEDEEAAQQETDAVSHIFWQKNDGFMVLYNWIKESLIQQNSYVTSGWDEKERVTIEEYDDLTPEEFLQVFQQIEGKKEFLEAEGFNVFEGQFVPDVDEMGQFAPIRVKIRVTNTEKRYKIECFPQEEFFITPGWPKVKPDGAPCFGRKRSMEVGDLLAMGFSEDSVEEACDADTSSEEADRHDTQDHFSSVWGESTGATREVTVFEAFVRADYNNDGKAELLKVWASGDGNTILRWENGEDAIDEVSHGNISCLTPYIVPHRHVGRSAMEQVDDIQKVKTVLFRHTLDNIYATNYARPQFDENLAGPDLFADLASPADGAPIRTGGAQVDWIRPPSVIDTTLPIIEMMDALKENRTGTTRYNQGLDAESLNKTASGIKQIKDAGSKRHMLVARVFAETGLKDLFLRIHRDLRNGPMREIVMRLRGSWTPVNPRTWRDRSDMVVRVGMGSGSRDMTREGLMLLKQEQQALLGMGSPMVGEKQIYNTAERLAETYGFNGIEPFLVDPETIPPPPPQEPPPDYQAMLIQAQLQQMQQQEARADRAQAFNEQVKMAELEIRKLSEMRQGTKSKADIYTNAERLDLDRDKAVMDDDFKRDKLETDAATGFYRDVQRDVNTAPPMPYRDILNG